MNPGGCTGGIIGIGVDIVEVERIESGVERYGERFRRKVFTDGEWDYCFRKVRPFEHLAGRFAAKEAVMKALGEGWTARTSFREIEIAREKGAAPEIVLSPRIRALLPEGARIWLSISHTERYAVAQVIITDGPAGGASSISPSRSPGSAEQSDSTPTGDGGTP